MPEQKAGGWNLPQVSSRAPETKQRSEKNRNMHTLWTLRTSVEIILVNFATS